MGLKIRGLNKTVLGGQKLNAAVGFRVCRHRRHHRVVMDIKMFHKAVCGAINIMSWNVFVTWEADLCVQLFPVFMLS